MFNPKIHENSIKAPLYEVIIEVALLWGLANFGYYILLPLIGIDLSYNIAPVAISIYFLLWAIGGIFFFWDLFSKWLKVDSRIWLDLTLSLCFATITFGLLYILTLLPSLDGPILAPYSDILFATPWYFLPKSIEILLQQVLITALLLTLYFRFGSLKKVVIGYTVIFGGAHVVLFSLSDAPTPYATMMTFGAVLSSLIFPYLILKIRGGFVYSYMVHLIFYIFLALLLHTWPPFGYWS